MRGRTLPFIIDPSHRSRACAIFAGNMATPADEKLKDLVHWTTVGCALLRDGHPVEALTNMRKAGEAAAKLIILHRWPGKRGTDALAGASFEDLIHLILRNGLAEGRTAGLLRTLQAEGNLATHDQRDRSGNPDLAYHALEELARWICTDLLGRAQPADLVRALNAPKEPKPQATPERGLLEMHERLAQQEERLAELEEARVTVVPGAPAAPAAPNAPGPDATLAAIEALRTEVANARQELRRAALAPSSTDPVPPPAQPARKRRWRTRVVVFLLVDLAIGLGWWMYHGEGAAPAQSAVAVPPAKPDSALRVLYIPFAVLQDDPQVRLDLAAAIEGRLAARSARTRQPVRLVVDTLSPAATPTPEQAWQRATANNAQLVLFGELLEPSATDSGTLSLQFALQRDDHVKSARMTPMRFRTLRDSGATRVLDQCVWAADMAVGNALILRGAYSQALALFNTAVPPTPDGELIRHVYLAQCHGATGNIPAALREAQWCMERSPDDPELNGFIGEVLTVSGDAAGALNAFERALALAPQDVEMKLGLANLLYDGAHPGSAGSARSKALTAEVLRERPDHGRAWFFHGASAYTEQRWPEAAEAYTRGLRTDDLSAAERQQATLLLAELDAFRLDRAAEGASLLNGWLVQYPTDARAHYLLGEVYNRSSIKDPTMAQEHFALARQLMPAAGPAATLGQAEAAKAAGNLEAARDLFAQAWARDSSNTRTANEYGDLLARLGDLPTAYRVLRRGLHLDPMDHLMNANMGEFLLHGPTGLRDVAAAERHLSIALATDPLDTFVLANLGGARFALGDLDGADKVLREAYRLAPADRDINRSLGFLRDAQGRAGEARTHYEKTLSVGPSDDLVSSNLAMLYTELRPPLLRQGLDLAERSVALRRSPENSVVLARLLALNQKVDRAYVVYSEAIQGRPDLRMADLEKIFADRGYR